jgi:hypothetical protein
VVARAVGAGVAGIVVPAGPRGSGPMWVTAAHSGRNRLVHGYRLAPILCGKGVP